MSTYTLFRPKPQSQTQHIKALRAQVLNDIEAVKAWPEWSKLVDAWGNWRALPIRRLSHETP